MVENVKKTVMSMVSYTFLQQVYNVSAFCNSSKKINCIDHEIRKLEMTNDKYTCIIFF